MKIVAVCQQKGGDGKTTISRLIGEYGDRQGLRVLMIDMDPQCNLSQRYLQMDADPAEPDGIMPPVHESFDPNDLDDTWNGRSAITGIFYGNAIVPYKTKYPNVQIIPGHGSQMRAVELVRREDVKVRIVDQLHRLLSDPEVSKQYDLVVIDTPPAKGPLVQSAIRAATHMLIPSQMEPMSQEGLRGMLQMWRRENRSRPAGNQLRLIGILPNKVRNVTLHNDILTSLRMDKVVSEYLFPGAIAQRTVFAETSSPNAAPKSVFELDASDKARQEAEAACQFIFSRLELQTEPARSAA